MNPQTDKQVSSITVLLLAMLIWTILVVVSLSVDYIDFYIPIITNAPYGWIICYALLWLVGVLSLWFVWKKFSADLRCRNMIVRQVLKAKNEWEATFDVIPNPIIISDLVGYTGR